MAATSTALALDERIGRDHYDLSAILERLLLSAANRDFERAMSDARIFERLGFAANASRALARIACGQAKVSAAKRVYVVEAPGAVDASGLADAIDRARATIGAFLGRDGQAVWVDFHDGPPFANVTNRELGSVARISLSRRILECRMGPGRAAVRVGGRGDARGRGHLPLAGGVNDHVRRPPSSCA